MKRLTEELSKYASPSILDVGTGGGAFIHLISSVYDDYSSIVGIDTYDKAIEAAKKNFSDQERVRFIQADILDNDFQKESFDIICLSNSLHHLVKKDEVIKEMIGLLKNDGMIIVNEMISNGLNQRQMSHMKLHHFAAEIDMELGMHHELTYEKSKIKELLSRFDMDVTSWDMEIERSLENTPEEIEWMMNTVDRLLSRTDQLANKNDYALKAEEIKEYIQKNGYDSATSVISLMKKKQ